MIYIDPIGPRRTCHLHHRLIFSLEALFWSTENLPDTRPSHWSVHLSTIKPKGSKFILLIWRRNVGVECTFLAEHIFVRFQIIRCKIVAEFGVIHLLENYKIVTGSCDLWQKRHLEEENVPRFPKLIRRFLQWIRPNGRRRSAHHNEFLYHRTEMVDKCPTDNCTPVMAN